MSIRLIVTRGYGNGIFNGSIKDVVLRGYEIGVTLSLNTPGPPITIFIDDLTADMQYDATQAEVLSGWS